MPFSIGIQNSKFEANVGSLLRSAYNFGASMVFTVGRRYSPARQRGDTTAAWRHLPVLHFHDWEDYKEHAPRGWIPIGIELSPTAHQLKNFVHPKQCVHILGPEDGSLSKVIQEMCKTTVVIPSKKCLNVAVAGSIVMCDRVMKE